tara:strand:- start:451 stop:1002 length:552 start_codon:yes stop_codon:yes gene_type:complete
MKKLIILFALGSFGLLLSSSPICTINQELNKDTASKLKEFRDQTLKTCLSCTDESCKLKSWPEDKKGDEAVCKLLFCTPSYVSKFFEKPGNVKPGKTKIKFSYIINSKGKIKDIEIKSANGAMNARESYKYLQSFTAKTQFEPLLISGKEVNLNDLQGEHIAYTGKYEDIDKTMPVNQGIWRN